MGKVRLSALRLAESVSLLLPEEARVRDVEPEWATWSAELKAASMSAVSAAGSGNNDDLMKAAGQIYQACTSCHMKYASALVGKP